MDSPWLYGRQDDEKPNGNPDTHQGADEVDASLGSSLNDALGGQQPADHNPKAGTTGSSGQGSGVGDGGGSNAGDNSKPSTTVIKPSSKSASVVSIEPSYTSKPSARPSGVSGSVDDGVGNSSGGGGGGGGGLSTGAIAGIAVGGGVVLIALVGVLVWFLLRRRRQNKQGGSYNKPTASTSFMAGEKEVPQEITESPHSTSYSQDRQLPLSLAAAGGVPSPHQGGRHEGSGEFSPYRDDGSAPSRQEARADGGGAGTPRGMSRTVAHLVEEGMTAEEIRRLEEEERQLDDAIEQHGRR